jgi:hypothetical protein
VPGSLSAWLLSLGGRYGGGGPSTSVREESDEDEKAETTGWGRGMSEEEENRREREREEKRERREGVREWPPLLEPAPLLDILMVLGSCCEDGVWMEVVEVEQDSGRF